ncbi:hypothetical protein ACQUJT_01670 [Ralstonia pseudosolanacearum]
MAEQPVRIPGAKRGAISPNPHVTAMTKSGSDYVLLIFKSI